MFDAKKVCFIELTVIIIITSLIFFNCDREGEHIPTFAPTASYYLQEGWKAFGESRYQDAVDNFTAAKNRNALESNAYLGLGWTYGRMLEFDLSISNFQLLLSLTESNSMRADAYAGLAMTYSAQRNDFMVIDAAQTAMNISPDYQFQYDPKITAAMLHVLIAQTYFNRQDYLHALEEVDVFLINGYIDELKNEGIIISESGKIFQANTFSQTLLNGIAELNISRTVITAIDTTEIDAELVRVQSIKSVSSGVEYQILNFVQGGGLVRFFGNPIPQAGEKFLVDYLYASDYGIFLSQLSKKIQELQDS